MLSVLLMTTIKKKNLSGTIWENLKLILSSKNNSSLLSNLKLEGEAIATQLNFQKIDNIFKLIYKLFLYSILGFAAKLVIKLFKL